MERHDAITRRPSLLAGGEEPTGARRPRERILPSIDTADAARTSRPTPRAWPWLLAAVLAVAAVALLVPWPKAPGGEERLPPLTASSDRAAPHQAPGAATIIDDAAATSGVGSSRAPDARPGAATQVDGMEEADPGTTPASPFAAMAPAGSAPNPFGDSPRSAAVDRRERAAPAPPAEGSEALLATLLGHIQSTPGPETPMDRMVERLAREEATTTPAAATQASTPPVQFRSFQIQMNLRDCPPANTTEGVACRARICEVYAGRDPACPAG